MSGANHKTKKKDLKTKRFTFDKKTTIAGGFIGAIAIAGIIGAVIILRETTPGPEIILKFGHRGFPFSLDPLEVEGPVDTNMLIQIAEGLFAIDKDLNIIYGLAVNHTWSHDNLNLTCDLRRGVKFHDDTPLDANAVKWNFDRVERLFDNISYPSFWLFTDGSPILNKTLALDNYKIRFVLNRPYGPFLSLLATPSSFIVSPTSTPNDRLLDIFSESTVGTGPFVFGDYHFVSNFTLTANSEYWGKKPKIDKLILFVSPSYTASELRLGITDITLNHRGFDEVAVENFKTNSSFVVTQDANPNLRWIIMNNKVINSTMRKAFSYAFNYSVIESFGGARYGSPLPETILFSNTSGINLPYYNLSFARQVLIDAGWPGTNNLTADNNISIGNEWELIANGVSPLATYNYTYVDDLFFPVEFLTLLPENFKQIGVRIEPVNVTSTIYSFMLENIEGYNRDMLELAYGYWYADNNHPHTFLNSLFTNETDAWNLGQVNDHVTLMLLEEAFVETDLEQQKLLYYQLQKHLIEEIFPILGSYSTMMTAIHVFDLKGWYNSPWLWPFKDVYF